MLNNDVIRNSLNNYEGLSVYKEMPTLEEVVSLMNELQELTNIYLVKSSEGFYLNDLGKIVPVSEASDLGYLFFFADLLINESNDDYKKFDNLRSFFQFYVDRLSLEAFNYVRK